MKKLTPRQQQAKETKQRIVDTATALFKTKGFETVTVQDICKGAGISVGAYYHHFKSKTEIINAGYIQLDEMLQERVLAKVIDENLERIKCILSEAGILIQEFGWAFVRFFYRELLMDKEKYTFNHSRFIYVEMESSIRKGIANKEFKEDVDAQELVNTILRVSRGVIFDWCLFEGSYNLRERLLSDFNLVIANYIREE